MIKKVDIGVISDIAFLLGAGTSIYYLVSFLLNQKSGPASSLANKKRADTNLRRLKLENPESLSQLDDYEQVVLGSVIGPEEITVGFKDIGGLDSIINNLRESVLYPLTEPDLYSHHSSLLQAPKGVILYGPPGCGKTMLAKALAKESGANFLNIKLSLIMDKWYGESNKIVSAIFSLASKLQPCIIFIDEIDSFLRDRSHSDHEMTATIKAEFMTLWDGLTSGGRILVLGATNRIGDIDAAFLRRMPKRIAVDLPNAEQRRRILKLLLHNVELAKDFDLESVVEATERRSGSDLKEMCRDAAMAAMREYVRANFRDGKRITSGEVKMRPIHTFDFLKEID